MEETRTKLANGVYLTCMPARKFKTSLLSAQFVVPIERGSASENALLPAVLRRGRPAARSGQPVCGIDRLYGAQIDYTVRKRARTSAWALWPT